MAHSIDIKEGKTVYDEENRILSGYLFKLSTPQAGGPTMWKERFFALIGNVITCYADHRHISEHRGEVFIFQETQVSTSHHHGKPFEIILRFPFEPIYLAAKTAEEQNMWLKAICSAIEVSKQSLRGYAVRIASNSPGQKKSRFCILHEDALTFHRDHNSLSSALAFFYLSAAVQVEFRETLQIISFKDLNTKESVDLIFIPSDMRTATDVRVYAEYEEWKAGLRARLEAVRAPLPLLDGGAVEAGAAPEAVSAKRSDESGGMNLIEEGAGEVFKEGVLGMRTSASGESYNWPKLTFRLRETTMAAVRVHPTTGQQEVLRVFGISPSSSAFETNLGANTFELVSSSTILHVCAESAEEMAEWIAAIQRAVSCAMFDFNDPLFQYALLKIDDDVMYEAHFTSKQPLGVVFERSGEWAITKSSTKKDVTGIMVGSVLSSINGVSTVTADYFTTVNKLRNWTPPLTLGFRCVPRKEAYLLKDSKSKTNPNKRVWKKRYFILDEGKLMYKDKHSDEAARIELPLMGSSVSLLDQARTGKANCFRILSGVIGLVVQCSTHRQVMDWAATIYHAVAIANGGAYVIDYEVDRYLSQFSDAATALTVDVIEYKRLVECSTRLLNVAIQTRQLARIVNAIQTVQQLPLTPPDQSDECVTLAQQVALRLAQAEALSATLALNAPPPPPLPPSRSPSPSPSPSPVVNEQEEGESDSGDAKAPRLPEMDDHGPSAAGLVTAGGVAGPQDSSRDVREDAENVQRVDPNISTLPSESTPSRSGAGKLVSESAVKAVANPLQGKHVEELNALLIAAMDDSSEDKISRLQDLVTSISQLQLDVTVPALNSARTQLNELYVASDEHGAAVVLQRAIQSRDIFALGSAIAVTEKIKTSSAELIRAKVLHSELSKSAARENLLACLLAAGPSNFQILERAVEQAELYDVDKALVADAKMELASLQSSHAEVHVDVGAEAAEGGAVAGVGPKRSTTWSAAQFGQAEAKANKERELAAVLRANASKLLASSLASSSTFDFSNLISAIAVARKRNADPTQIQEAEALLSRLKQEAHDLITSQLASAYESKDMASMEDALIKAHNIKFSSDLLDTVRAHVESTRSIQARKVVFTRLLDAIRLKSIAALKGALMYAHQHSVREEAVQLASTVLSLMQSRDKLADAEDASLEEENRVALSAASAALLENLNESMGRRRAPPAPVVVSAAAAASTFFAAPVPMSPLGCGTTASIDEEDDTLETDEVTSNTASPSKAIHDNGELVTVKLLHTVWKKYCSKAGSATINAMQFSSSFRLMTGVKGNLYKEMQMFKRFDTSNNGALTEEDWTDGWLNILKSNEYSQIREKITILAQ